MKYVLFFLALIISAHANASESARQAKISKIMEAQGLLQMFQQQLDQSKASASDLGKSLYQKILSESNVADEHENPKLEEIFTRHIERCATLFSAKEFVETWSRFYGTDLTEAELDKILAYYKSSVGRKDTAATQAAMIGFSRVLSEVTQERVNDSVGQLMAELKAATEMPKPAVKPDATQ